MADVLFFSYHNTTAWWQYLAKNLDIGVSTAVVSDIREDVDICIVDDFYHNLRNIDCAEFAKLHFSEAVCDDIVRRCRVLRNLNKKQALAMIGSMCLVFSQIIQTEKPKLVVSFIIDRYTTDVMHRVLRSHNIPFLQMTASIAPDHVMFMERGKLMPVRVPEQEEIEHAKQQLLQDSFTPAYVKTGKKYTSALYWRTFLYFKLRGLAFQCIRYLKRDRLNLHYLDALNYLDHKPRLPDYTVLSYFDKNWEQKLNEVSVDKRVFLALQLLPEASIDYWIDNVELLNNEQVVERACEVLTQAGYTVFVKDHPLQFGFRKRAVIKQLKKIPGVILVPYDAPAMQLIKQCAATVTCTGTVGFQSILAGACSVVSGAYYSDDAHFVHFHSLADIALLPEKMAAYKNRQTEKISDEAVDSLVCSLLAASMPGDLFSFKHFDPDNTEHRASAQTLLDSFNKYLPAFIATHEQKAVV